MFIRISIGSFFSFTVGPVDLLDEFQVCMKIFKHFFRNWIYYEIIVTPDNLDNDTVVCTGKQTIQLIDALQGLLSGYQWFMADIRCIYNDPDTSLPMQDLLIGNTENLIKYISNVSQFMSGIFLGIPENNIKKFKENLAEVFDTETRETYLGTADLEIRAFDTSFFLIYTTRKDIVRHLSARFLKIVIKNKRKK